MRKKQKLSNIDKYKLMKNKDLDILYNETKIKISDATILMQNYENRKFYLEAEKQLRIKKKLEVKLNDIKKAQNIKHKKHMVTLNILLQHLHRCKGLESPSKLYDKYAYGNPSLQELKNSV